MLPTALTEIILSTPSFFMAYMFALKLISVGSILWPLPCLGRKTSLLPLNVPRINLSEGIAKWGLYLYLLNICKPFHFIQTASADYADICVQLKLPPLLKIILQYLFMVKNNRLWQIVLFKHAELSSIIFCLWLSLCLCNINSRYSMKPIIPFRI